MGLFDKLKPKTEPNPNPGNALEPVLRKAATEAAYRPAFYEKLLADKLVVLTAKSALPEGEQTLQENTM